MPHNVHLSAFYNDVSRWLVKNKLPASDDFLIFSIVENEQNIHPRQHKWWVYDLWNKKFPWENLSNNDIVTFKKMFRRFILFNAPYAVTYIFRCLQKMLSMSAFIYHQCTKLYFRSLTPVSMSKYPKHGNECFLP